MATPTPYPVIAALALLAGCAPAGSSEPGAAALTPKQVERMEKQLADKVPGEPVRCLPNYRTTDTIRVSDTILLYRANGNLVYRNDLKGSCPGLARDSDIMVVRQFGPSTCDGDFFHLVDRSSGIRGPTCVFGPFVPYRKPAGDAG
ncbi:MAG: hypothetical protein DI569_10465 [Sphingopyxis macrogoltabida]|uniref:Lipoprotein n=1 Tax=Sphingopyxis macrogoltabida TaxID=33050 RepID=A0A2W5L2U8_SPHMC|nr:MAG: hypothetical protein DI569_10465 [Sphingopyxis macrogoltabida]